MKRIVRYIERHVDSISAVLILADIGFDFFQGFTRVDSNYMFSTLSTILPKTLFNNIAFMFMDGKGPLPLFFPREMAPEALKNSPVFPLDELITKILNGNQCAPLERIALQDHEQRVLEMLVNLFDWLNDLEPQPATEIVSLYEKYQVINTMTINFLDRRTFEVEIDSLIITLREHSAVSISPYLHLALDSYARWM